MTDSSTGGFLQSFSTPPAEDAGMDTILQGLVVGVSGLPENLVRPRWQLVPEPQPEPSVDWCAIGVTEEEPEPRGAQIHVGRDDSGTNPNGYTRQLTWMTVTVLASFYGPNARANSDILRDGLLVAQNREYLYGLDLALVARPGQGRFVPEIINQQTIRRVDLEMKFRRTVTRYWPILDLLKGEIVITTETFGDASSSVTVITPSSTDPLEP